MPEQEEKFFEMVAKLNSLYNYVKWEEVTAAKEHTDIFGVTIKENESYFKREISTDFRNAMRLSRSSMENLIFSLFHHNGDLIGLTDHIIETEKAELKEKRGVKKQTNSKSKNKNTRLSVAQKLLV